MSETPEEVADLSVLHIGAGRYKPGDDGHPTFDIWRALAQGFRRYTVIGRSTRPQASVMRENNLTVHLLPSRLAREAEFLFTQFSALRIAREVKADVVISQSPVLGGVAGLAICRRMGAKHLVELHGSEFVSHAPFGSKNWILQHVSAHVFRYVDKIRVLSNGMKDQVVSKYDKELDERIAVLPPRVDLSKFAAKTDWSSSGHLTVVMVGYVNSNKGQKRLINVLCSSGLPVDIWIVGDGPELQACKTAAAKLGVGERLRFFGRVGHTELAEILPLADVFVMFSTHEGTPRAIMEAMAAGLPVVTTNAGFCADIVGHEIEGIVLGPNPEGEVVSVLQRLFEDPELRARMGKAARIRAERDYDADKLYVRYRALIRETAAA